MEKELIVRIVVSVITIVNLLATQFGFNPLDISEETVYTVVSAFAVVAAWVWGFWKNNNFTKNAKKAQEYLEDLKADEDNYE